MVLSNLARAGFEISPGDFVRWCRQIIDVLEQLARIDPSLAGDIPGTAAKAVASMRRGVLADLSRPPGEDFAIEEIAGDEQLDPIENE